MQGIALEQRTTVETGLRIVSRLSAYDFSVAWIEDRLPPSFARGAIGESAATYLRERFPWRLSDGSRNKNRLTLEACLREIRRQSVIVTLPSPQK